MVFDAASEDTLWEICVTVGFGGAEVSISVCPVGRIYELKSKIEAETGKTGKLFHLEKGTELFDDQIISTSISDRSSVVLVIDDSFTREKEALLALRDSTNFASWREHAKAGWLGLETFTEPGQLGACRGVTVDDGHVVKLALGCSGLTGLCASNYLTFPIMYTINAT